MNGTSDVIVVGGGPTGLTVASELVFMGARVTILERRTAPVGSRASSIMPRVLELLHMRGMLSTFIDRARQIQSSALLPTHSWGGMSPLDWSQLDTPFPYRLLLPQNYTEELLTARAHELGVDIRTGVKVVGLEQDDDEVRVTTDDGEVHRARYVVGADGGHSTVREAVGIDFVGHDGHFTGIAADVAMPFPLEDSTRTVFENERGWLTLLPFSDDDTITRFVMVHAEGMKTARDVPITIDEVRGYAEDISGLTLDVGELAWASRYTDAMKLASRFRVRRVLIVGEATRIHYPASGVGMNFCIQDAFNLGWKLAAVINGQAPDELLDTFETERRPIMEDLLESVKSQVAAQFTFTPEGMALKRFIAGRLMGIPEVNRIMASDENGLSTRYAVTDGVEPHPLIGRPMPNLAFLTPEGRTHVLELLRDATFLLFDLTGRAGWDLGAVGDTPVKIILAQVSGPAPQLAGATAVLVRPDGYVAFVGHGPDELKSGLDAVDHVLRRAGR